MFDEPTAGLHAADVERMNTLLRQLRDTGNTVLVVEHHPGIIAIADHIIDMGPGAGVHGGDVVYQGDLPGLRASGTITGNSLEHRTGLKSKVRDPTGTLSIRNISRHNLRDVSVEVPPGVLTAVTGVAGSGKSTLLAAGLADREDVVVIDQTPIRGSRRSNPATYTGALDAIRKAFAKAHGVKPGLFSVNSDGACPECQGAGAIYLDFGFMQGQSTVCGACQGRRFNTEVLHYELGGKNIADVLELPAEAAVDYLAQVNISAAAKVAQRCVDVGLSYVRLSQPLTTLSGGERQRLKLVASLAKPAAIYVLDEPTTGLHIADVGRSVTLLNAMVDAGTTVIVIEHDFDVVAAADWVIDVGPGAGAAGGRLIFEGTPHQLLTADTPTGRYFAQALTPAG